MKCTNIYGKYRLPYKGYRVYVFNTLPYLTPNFQYTALIFDPQVNGLPQMGAWQLWAPSAATRPTTTKNPLQEFNRRRRAHMRQK